MSAAPPLAPEPHPSHGPWVGTGDYGGGAEQMCGSCGTSLDDVQGASRACPSVRRIPLDPQPELRWNHMGGAWFCRGEHEKAALCSAHAEEVPCPHGVVGENVTVEQDPDGTWVWVVDVGSEAA